VLLDDLKSNQATILQKLPTGVTATIDVERIEAKSKI
jgi:hypothetical protein